MNQLDDILQRLATMDESTKDQVRQLVVDQTGDMPWYPNPGPQLEAYDSQADVMLYGGQGGGGKTDLICGMAVAGDHERSLIMRPQYTDIGALIERIESITRTTKGWNKSPPAQFRYSGKVVDFGGAANLDQAKTWQGNPHDLQAFDEACLFQEAVVRFIMGWNRRAKDEIGDNVGEDIEVLRYIAANGRYPKDFERSRVLMASNPPMDANGDWIIPMFRPWLDTNLPRHLRAEHGELRWVITDPDGKDVWVDGPMDIREWNGQTYTPRSRTFIPAKLQDNPFLIGTGYQQTLDAMPEPMRSAIRDGNFMAAREDDAMQVVPTEWVLKANDRWRKGKPQRVPMTAIGVDVARGGRDETVLSPRYGTWFDEQIAVPGRETPNGPTVVALVAGVLRDQAIIGFDPIGIGADAETAFANTTMLNEGVNGSESSTAHTRDGNFAFYNMRSEIIWMVREALDPDYGQDLALPPDSQLLADLTAFTFEVRPGGKGKPKIYVESTIDVKKRIGRSPDRAMSIFYSWAVGGMMSNEHHGSASIMYTPPPTEAGYDPLRH
jgi:hypothetical protein